MKDFDVKIERSDILNGNELQVAFNLKSPVKNVSIWLKLLTGAIIGFINGFWGGGGGMVCVPLLMYAIHLPEKKAHATTLLIMLPLCVASLITYIFSGNLMWVEGLQIGGGFVVGGIIGACLLKKISNLWLSIFFSVIIIAGGIKILI